MITRASNNYGPYQFPEKLIPLMISNALEDRPLPVYGDGMQVRDWLYVDDHCRGILAVLEARARRRDLQHRRQPLAAEHRCGAPDSGAHRQAGEPDQVRDGPSRARPPLRAFEREADARNRLATADGLRPRARRHDRLVSRQHRRGWRGCAAANTALTTNAITATGRT